MTDLFLGITIVLATSVALFLAALRLSRKASRAVGVIWIGLMAGFLLLHATVLLDNVQIARLLPFSNLIVIGNFSPLAVAVMAGLSWRRLPGAAWRRAVLVVPLVGICLWKAYAPVFVDPPDLADRWRGEVCRQTSSSSCSAAAAATMLRVAGIETTEGEMARLCLTSDQGTTMHGLYRGLKLKTAGTAWDIEPLAGRSVDELRAIDGPAILTVGIEVDDDLDPRYARDWGWAPGVKHTVVLFGFTPAGHAELGDPNVGVERWDEQTLRTLWRGEAIRLVRRSAQ